MDFSTERTAFDQAFNKVMSGVEAPHLTKAMIRESFYKAHSEGAPRMELIALTQHLLGINWRWTEFERWRAEFRERKKWPYMWHRLYLDEDTSEIKREPKSVKTALWLFTVNDLRQLLKESGIKPLPKSRADVEQVVVINVPWPSIKETVAIRYKDYVDEQMPAEPDESKILELLAHTISMTAYAFRDSLHRQEANINDDRLVAEDAGCPVEKSFAKRYNAGEKLGIPPFFPGDRTTLIVRQRPRR